MSLSSDIENPYNRKPKAMVTPVTSTSTSSQAFCSTQEAIEAVQEEIKDYHSHSMSGRKQSMVMIGAGVSELKQEVFYLRTQLERSRHNEEFLRHKLAFYQQREEDELISLSMEHDKYTDSFKRKRNFSTYASANFSPNFNRSYK